MVNQKVESTKRIGVGLAFILWPLVAAVAYAAHPNLLSLEMGGEVSGKIAEFHNNRFMHFGHLLMVLGVPLLFVVAAKFMNLLKGHGAWLGFIGGVMAMYGALFLAVQKTALCLVMSALDTLPEAMFQQMFPGIEALFNLQGYLAVVYLLPLLPLGVLLQSIGLYQARAIARWQTVLMMVAMLGLSVSAAFDIDLFGLVASVILAISWVPLGVHIIKDDLESPLQEIGEPQLKHVS